MSAALKHLRPGEGPTCTVLGTDIVCCKAASSDTGGAYSLLETIVPPGGGPPPHVHHREDEAFYVLEGQFEFQVANQTIQAGPGSFLIAPRDIPHSFRNSGSTPGKLLITVQPAGFENFIAELGQIPMTDPPDWPRLSAVANKYGLEFL